MANESINKLAKTLAESLPEGLRSVRDELEKNFRSVLQTGLGKLDLVTREEFSVQEAVLARTRQKLEALEARLNALVTQPTPPAPTRQIDKAASRKKVAKKRKARRKAARQKNI